MSAEPGGIASKLGDQYERGYAVESLLKLITGECVQLRWEPASSKVGGADIRLDFADGTVEEIQLKRQNSSFGKWTVANLAAENVLLSISEFADQHPTGKFTFVSSDHVPHLKDISDQLCRNSDSPKAFIANHIDTNKKRKIEFSELLKRWDLRIDNELDCQRALDRLARVRWVVLDRSQVGRDRLLQLLNLSFSGEPTTAYAQLALHLEEQLGKAITQQSLYQFMLGTDLRLRDLTRDKFLPETIHGLQNSFRANLESQLIDGSWIGRTEVRAIVRAIQQDSTCRFILLHGRPGGGKSSVLLGLANELVKEEIPNLPISVVTYPPQSTTAKFGEMLGLDATPASALRATAGLRKAVLILDQLDALRYTTPGAATAWSMCQSMLREAYADRNTIIVVACRTFDLENDEQIRQWRDSIKGTDSSEVVEIAIGDLNPIDVQSVLSGLGQTYDSLSANLQRLLLRPSALYAWHRLSKGGAERHDFSTHTQLISALLKQLRTEATRDHGAADADIDEAMHLAAEFMHTSGTLSVPQSKLQHKAQAMNACVAVDLFVQNGRQISFAHQNYYDHLIAQDAMVSSGYDAEQIVAWISKDQSLQRREQMRHLLLLLRDEMPSAAANVLKQVVESADVRFHLKLLALGVAREATPITHEDAQAISALMADPAWEEHVRTRVLWKSANWFDSLDIRQAIHAAILSSDSNRKIGWFQLLYSIAQERPAQVDEILAEVVSEAGEKVATQTLPYDPSDDSDLMSMLRLKQLKRGGVHFHESLLDRIAKTHPQRALGILAATIRGKLRDVLRTLPASEVQGDRMRLRAKNDDLHVAIKVEGVTAYRELSRLLIVTERLQLRSKPGLSNLENDEFGVFLRNSAPFTDLQDVLAALVSSAIEGIAESAPDELARILDSFHAMKSVRLAEAIAFGLASSSDQVADLAILWALAPLQLQFAEHSWRDRHWTTAAILRKHWEFSSEDTTTRMAAYLRSYWPKSEKERYRDWISESSLGDWGYNQAGRYYPVVNPIGRAQHILLGAIPETRRDSGTRDRLLLLNTKFGGLPKRDVSASVRAGFVSSPIPDNRLIKLSDKSWHRIVSSQWDPQHWKHNSDGRLSEASHRHFATDLGTATKSDPARYTRLASSFPRCTPQVYFARILHTLRECGDAIHNVDMSCLRTILDVVANENDSESIRAACGLIEKFPDLDWEDAAWSIFSAATSNEEPAIGEATVFRRAGGEHTPDWESTSSNCARGAGASALARFIWGDETRATMGQRVAQKLASDPHPAVRMAAAEIAYGYFSTDKSKGIQLLVDVAKNMPDEVLGSRQFIRAIGHMRWAGSPNLEPILRRMIVSPMAEVARWGAFWVAAELQQSGRYGNEYYECINGTVAQRKGIVEMLHKLMAQSNNNVERVERDLSAFFNDEADEVRSEATNVFREEGVTSAASGLRLAQAFVESRAFAENHEPLIWRLSNEVSDLLPYSEIIFTIADRFALEFAADTRDPRRHHGLSSRDLSSILLRLYGAASKLKDATLLEKCLDRWDLLLKNRVNEVEADLEKFIQ